VNRVASMTGSGTASGETELGRTVVELRAVNGRGLTIKQRLPAAAAGMEGAIERAIAARLRRGTVTCVVEATSDAGPVAIDSAALTAAARALRAAAEAAGLAPPTLGDVLAVPGVLAPAQEGPRAAREPSPAFRALLDRALGNLVAERLREGAATARAAAELFAELRRRRAAVAERAPTALAEWRGRLLQRVNDFLAGQARPMEPGDVLREVALYAERSDASEELQRIDAHLDRSEQMLAAGGEVGRSLEFLLQELLREVNTLGSKAQDAPIAHEVVGMKAAIEKLRELVANLE